MSKAARVTLLVVIILSVVAWALYPRFGDIFSSSSEAGGGPPAAFGPTTTPVTAKVITPSRLENKILITGSILPNEELEVKSEVSGVITQLGFVEGEDIVEGQPLVSLKDDELRAQLEKLRYSKKLNEELEFRQRKLLEKEAISQEEYDISLTQLNTSEADIKLLQVQLDKMTIKAPFDGVVGFREVSVGAYITSSDVITNFYSLDPVIIEFSIPGKYAGEVKVRDMVNFKVDAFTEQFQGRVYAIEPRIDPNTRTLKIRAFSRNKERKLLPGQFARIELIMETIEDAMLVPTEAVVPELNGHKVYVARGGKAESRKVQIGIRTNENVQIIDGISLQDTVITSGILQMRPGASVSITSVN
ncbi:MAG: efflux RND transporter periplasmic adaptor subunit [Roseivirga sp.]|nr:efflux RND transporter periplasmic adaptor subunit [Roseivirga sp.]